MEISDQLDEVVYVESDGQLAGEAGTSGLGREVLTSAYETGATTSSVSLSLRAWLKSARRFPVGKGWLVRLYHWIYDFIVVLLAL